MKLLQEIKWLLIPLLSIKLLLIVAATYFNYAIAGKQLEYKNEIMRSLDLSGNVKSVIVPTSWAYYNNIFEEDSKCTDCFNEISKFYFDTSGILLKREILASYEAVKPVRTFEYYYDRENRLIKKTMKNSKGVLYGRINYEYYTDFYWKLNKGLYYSLDTRNSSHNTDAVLVSGSTNIYSRNPASDEVFEIRILRKDGRMIEKHFHNIQYPDYYLGYDEDRLSYIKETYQGVFVDSTSFTYNKTRRLIKVQKIDMRNNIDEVDYEYDLMYDSKGNWVKQTKSSANEVIDEANRIIEYY